MAADSERQGGAVACTTEQTQLGEGVRWDAQRGELLRVDILAGRVYRDQVTASAFASSGDSVPGGLLASDRSSSIRSSRCRLFLGQSSLVAASSSFRRVREAPRWRSMRSMVSAAVHPKPSLP